MGKAIDHDLESRVQVTAQIRFIIHYKNKIKSDGKHQYSRFNWSLRPKEFHGVATHRIVQTYTLDPDFRASDEKAPRDAWWISQETICVWNQELNHYKLLFGWHCDGRLRLYDLFGAAKGRGTNCGILET